MNNKTISKEFYTISHDPNDVRSLLEENYNLIYETSESFGTKEIYEIIKSCLSKRPFSEYLKELLLKHGIKDEPRQYILERFVESGIISSVDIFSDDGSIITREHVRKNIKNWFSSSTPSRKYAFLLAAALRLSCDELTDLLCIGCMDRNVNFKDPAEVMIYSALRQKKDYSYVLKLYKNFIIPSNKIEEIMNLSLTGESYSKFLELSSEDELISYIRTLRSDDKERQTSRTSLKCYRTLIGRISEFAAMDKKLASKQKFGTDLLIRSNINFGTIERWIYFFMPRENKNRYMTDPFARYENGNISGRKKNELGNVKWFFSTLLRRQDLQKMYEDKEPITRDTILTLAFISSCESRPFDGVYEIISDINDILGFCRFEPMNFSFPYDFFLFMCIQTNDPLMVFREIWARSWSNDSIPKVTENRLSIS